MAFARRQFELSEPQSDGSPLLAHLQAIWKATGQMPELLASAPPLPAGCGTLWRDYLELHDSRGSTGWGAARITFVDMKAWQELRRTRLEPWEIDCIRKTDSMWLNEFAPKPKEDAK